MGPSIPVQSVPVRAKGMREIPGPRAGTRAIRPTLAHAPHPGSRGEGHAILHARDPPHPRLSLRFPDIRRIMALGNDRAANAMQPTFPYPSPYSFQPHSRRAR
jgi:hypothetical protein